MVQSIDENRKHLRYLMGFLTTRKVDWDKHVALVCFRCSTSQCTATSLTTLIVFLE